MISGELSFKFAPSLRVTWTIRDFFWLATKSDCSLRSPDFTFADGRHCLRLFQDLDFDGEWIEIEFMNSNGNYPGRAALAEVVFKSTAGELDLYTYVNNEKAFRRDQSDLEHLRVPGGTLTVVCNVRSREPGSPESVGAEPPVFPEYTMTGNLSCQSYPWLYVTWRIPSFFKLTRESGYHPVSREFPFSDRPYRLRLVLYKDVVEIHLVSATGRVPGRYVSYEFGFKSTTGEEIDIFSYGTSTERNFWIPRSKLDALQRVHFPDGHLTVFCCMRSREPSSSKAPLSQTAARPKSVVVQTANEDDKEALPGDVAKLLSDYKRLLLKGAGSDACLVVCGKEFQVHRNVLRARSPVFEAMFDHKTTENASGRVVIDDLKPDRFHDFLEYLYTGRVESFCDDNAFGLYAAADKYDVPTLKSACMEYMRRSLSVDNFCDVITLALRHHEQDLLKQAVEFFKKNVAGIILTVKWQQFMSENSTRANELFIKLLVPGKESENVLLP